MQALKIISERSVRTTLIVQPRYETPIKLVFER
jgi:hypothetical protein